MFAPRSLSLRVASIVGVLLALMGAALGPGGAGADPVRPGPPGDTEVRLDGAQGDPSLRRTGPLNVMIELTGAASGATYADARARGASAPDAAQEARTQKARVEQAQQSVLGALRVAVPAARVTYRTQAAYNGIAVVVDAGSVARLRGLPGVKAVHLIPLMGRDNASSVPLIGAPTAWQSSGGLTGTGVRIGVIDTGIDYVHTNFGGSGSGEDYALASSAANNLPGTALPILRGATPLFPNAKVAGGYDFAGDAYDANATGPAAIPVPDPNPQDCPSARGGGHGSHVAGTAAGFGVNGDGSTYAGGYGGSVPFDTLRIGPGVAPQARLYALRVFGCTGSTSLTTQAIDWATDPNNDGDPSDHLDVINMSLGSPYGTPDSPEAVASNNAAAAGVLVAISAGNSNDVYYVSGSPGSAARALTVASSVDSTDIVDGFDVSIALGGKTVFPATRSANYPWLAQPPTPPAVPLPVTAPLYYPTTNQYGCNAWTGADAANIAGKVVLVDWRKTGDVTFPCGSAVRTNNATTAGAKGIIMVDNTVTFETSIAGNATIPAMYSNSDTGTALKGALTAGTPSTFTVTLSTAHFNQIKLVLPGRIDTLSSFTSRGPRLGDNGLKPDISAPGQSIFSTNSGTGNGGESLSGTSMASPHMAGVLALLRQQHPGWSVEELKALAMNTATHDLFTDFNQTGTRYGPGRVGAGRVDVPNAIGSAVVAYLDDGSGQVSVSFGAVEVVGTRQLDKTVRVSNRGGAAATYTLGYDPRTAIPGVGYSFPDGPTVAVPAGGAATFRVRLTADAAQMRNTRDGTVSGAQAGNPRQWLSEASGLLTLSPSGGGTALRVPVYAAARPASAMTTAQGQLVFPNATGAANLTLTGQGVDTGTDYPTDITSVVTALELAATSPPATLGSGVSELARDADLQAVGVTAARASATNPSRINNSTLYFGIATHGNWSAPASEVEFDIYLDLDRDGTDDYVLYNTRLTDSDVFVTNLFNLRTSASATQGFTNVFNSNRPTAPFNNNVLVMPVNVTGTSAGLAFGSPSTRFNYRVATYSRSAPDLVDLTDVLTYDYATPGLDFQANGAGVPMYTDRPGDNLPVTFNQAAYTANGSLGALLLHHYNATGSRAQILPVRLAQTITFAPPTTKTYGDAPFAVSATSSAGLPVTISSLTPDVCTVGGANTVTILAAGTCTLRASAADNGTYAAASVDATIAIAKANQTIAFDPLPNRTYGDPAFAVSATASSGLPVSLIAGPASVCASSGNSVTLTGPGDCTVTATQGGNANYNAAPNVARTFRVAAAAVPSPSPAPSFTVTVTTSGVGGVSPGSGTYSGTQTFVATPGGGNLFLGWTVDGAFVGFGNPLALPVTKARTVVATFAPRGTFSDVPSGAPYNEVIAQLAARGIIRGFGDGTARPGETLLRAQMAGLLVRTAGWDDETRTNPFRDQCDEAGQACIDPALWNEVAILNFHDVARGYPDNVYLPRNAVLHVQVISFITRTMVAKGYWDLAATDDPTIYPNVPGASGHRLDLVTFVRYAGAIPGQPANSSWADWDAPSSRGWAASLLWQAYSSYFSTNRVP